MKMFSLGLLVVMFHILGTCCATGQQRAVGDIRADARAFVDKLKAATTFELRSAALLDLMWLHAEVSSHPQLLRSDELQSVRRLLVARLRAGMNDQRREMQRRWSQQQNANRQHNSAGSVVGNARGITQQDLDQWNAYQGYRTERWTGGADQYFSYMHGNFSPPGHHADALIRMIERTISPQSWQRQGGNSVIEYYGPAMVLVIRADQRTHDDVHDLLRTNRARDW